MAQAELRELLERLRSSDDAELAAHVSQVLLDSFGGYVGVGFDRVAGSVSFGDGALVAAGERLLADGSAPPFPIGATARLSVDFSNGAPSVVVVLLLHALSGDGGEVRIGPGSRAYVGYELTLHEPEPSWRCGGWSNDEYGEFE